MIEQSEIKYDMLSIATKRALAKTWSVPTRDTQQKDAQIICRLLELKGETPTPTLREIAEGNKANLHYPVLPGLNDDPTGKDKVNYSQIVAQSQLFITTLGLARDILVDTANTIPTDDATKEISIKLIDMRYSNALTGYFHQDPAVRRMGKNNGVKMIQEASKIYQSEK